MLHQFRPSGVLFGSCDLQSLIVYCLVRTDNPVCDPSVYPPCFFQPEERLYIFREQPILMFRVEEILASTIDHHLRHIEDPEIQTAFFLTLASLHPNFDAQHTTVRQLLCNMTVIHGVISAYSPHNKSILAQAHKHVQIEVRSLYIRLMVNLLSHL